MKNIVEAVAAVLHVYIHRLFAIVAAPRLNIPRLVHEPRKPLNDALSFVAVTFAITFVLQAPLITAQADTTTVAATLLGLKLFAIIAFNAALLLTFRIVRGTGTFEDTLTASIYILSPTILFVVLCRLLTLGLLVDTPQIAETLASGTADPTTFDALAETHPGRARALMVVAAAIAFGPVLWFLYCWRIYRDLHGLSWLRSAVAYLIAFALFALVAQGLNIASRGVFGAEGPGIL